MCTASLLAPAAAHAAEFKWWKGPRFGTYGLQLSGDIVTGDKDRFELYYKAILAYHERSRNPYVYATQFAPVVTMHLSSQGGVIGEAVYIGILIKKYEIETYVSNNSTCASACGFMWLAGSRRFIDSDSRVGFHAVYNRETVQVSSSSNAVVGAYLFGLGFDFDTIAYLTGISPDSMLWLSKTAAEQHGIKAKMCSNAVCK